MADYGLIIDNRKVATATTFDILNPATGELVGKAPVASREQLDQAVAAAARAYAAGAPPARSDASRPVSISRARWKRTWVS